MKLLWCWRCKMRIPMLDEEEFAEVTSVYRRSKREAKDPREEICKVYNRITGFNETNGNAVMHHRITLCGPPCPDCGKPFRTPQAGFCAACGYRPPRDGPDGEVSSAAPCSLP